MANLATFYQAIDALNLPILQLGLPDVFIDHGDPGKLLAAQGLDAAQFELGQMYGKGYGVTRDAAAAWSAPVRGRP